MGQWDDKFERAERKCASWTMGEYAQHDRVLGGSSKTRRESIHIARSSSFATRRSHSSN